MDFDSLQDDGAQVAANAPAAPAGQPKAFDDLTDDSVTYEGPGQTALAAAEGVGQGLLGPVIPAIERGLGRSPESMRGTAAAHPWAHGIGEALGIGAPAILSGGMSAAARAGLAVPEAASLGARALGAYSQAGLMGKAGEAVAAAAGLGGEGASVASRLAAGGAKMATEMGLFQAADEATKVVLDAPNSPGQAASNIGLSALLGGVAGVPLTGIGMAAKSAINSQFIREFTDQIAARGAGIRGPELIEKELQDTVSKYDTMNHELRGPEGLRAQALQNIMPEMSEEISSQTLGIAKQLEDRIAHMRARPNDYPERLVNSLEEDLKKFKTKSQLIKRSGGLEEEVAGVPKVSQESVSVTPIRFDENPAARAFPWLRPEDAPPTLVRGEEQLIQHEMRNAAPSKAVKYQPITQASVSDVFDASNELKNDLFAYSKGKFGEEVLPKYHEAYNFINSTKELASGVKNGLEDPGTWGPVAELQTDLNKAWHGAIPAMDQAKGRFFVKVGNEYQISPQKLESYWKQGAKATASTDRQKIMGNFINKMDEFQGAVESAYDKAGMASPHEPMSIANLRESVDKQSVPKRLADLWYDRVGPTGMGEALGGAAGYGMAAATGLPEAGFGGAYLGKWVLGPVFGSLIKATMEKGVNMPAYRQLMAYGKNIVAGNAVMTNAAANLFQAGAKTLPSHLMPNDADLVKLDKQAKAHAQNPAGMLNVAGDTGHYAPDHAQALSQTAATAVTYLNAQRPQSSPRVSPLDASHPPTKEQDQLFKRTLEIAQQPLLAMQHIKDGTLLPQDIATIKAIYPSYYDKMSQEIHNALADHLSKEGAVPYKTRQSMSLFLGQPMDSTMLPGSIEAIQSVYAQKAAMNQAPPQGGKTKKGTNHLTKMASSLQTNDQARASRVNKA